MSYEGYLAAAIVEANKPSNDPVPSKDLVSRLREQSTYLFPKAADTLMAEAADKIELLQRENRRAMSALVRHGLGLDEQPAPEPCPECEKRKHANDRINYETTEDGFRICRGYHHRSADCEWEYYVRRSSQPPGEGQ